MKACIYARTSSIERGPNTTSIPNQIEFCRDLARRHNLLVHEYNVFTDIEMAGTLPPTCWARDGEASRPALSAMVEGIENAEFTRVVVRRIEKLGTASEVLLNLLALFTRHGVRVVVEREGTAPDSDPRGAFAASILRPCIQYDTDFDEERRTKARARKREEIERLRAKIARLEAEIAES